MKRRARFIAAQSRARKDKQMPHYTLKHLEELDEQMNPFGEIPLFNIRTPNKVRCPFGKQDAINRRYRILSDRRIRQEKTRIALGHEPEPRAV